MKRFYIEKDDKEVGNYKTRKDAFDAFRKLKEGHGPMIIRVFEGDSVIAGFERTEEGGAD